MYNHSSFSVCINTAIQSHLVLIKPICFAIQTPFIVSLFKPWWCKYLIISPFNESLKVQGKMKWLTPT